MRLTKEMRPFLVKALVDMAYPRSWFEEKTGMLVDWVLNLPGVKAAEAAHEAHPDFIPCEVDSLSMHIESFRNVKRLHIMNFGDGNQYDSIKYVILSFKFPKRIAAPVLGSPRSSLCSFHLDDDGTITTPWHLPVPQEIEDRAREVLKAMEDRWVLADSLATLITPLTTVEALKKEIPGNDKAIDEAVKMYEDSKNVSPAAARLNAMIGGV